ncbi:SWIM zinc finger family protein [Halostella salina]|uniref:SWIM zinc finger family protein n=1 Tax=Halostella salina TaxID=1547897 RepID=UPI000EF80A5B|nr:SWIM zinc finger family protein [Halostella salina]
MTQSELTAASSKTTLPVPRGTELDERSRRARTEPMSVTAYGTDLYEVESASGETYHVNLPAGRCTCPDHAFRGARCKHVRRVAIEVNEGRVPPPGTVAAACATCGATTFVPTDAPGPHFCADHRIRVGDRVRDRETGDRLQVVAVSDRRADEVAIDRSVHTVADYPTNRDYPADDPVVGVVYPQSVRIGADGPTRETLRVYSFPRTRLERMAGDGHGGGTRVGRINRAQPATR